MVEERVQRKLAAILAADVVGYSRRMAADEAGTLAALKAHRKELLDPKTAEHGGRIVKLMGDGALVEFPSVVDAVECAVAIQRGMAERNANVPEDQRITWRMGINLGDVIIDGDDIYGDGVNVASRLENLAEPGGICISSTVREQVRDKVPIAFADLGERSIKNIERPVHVYYVQLEEAPHDEAPAREELTPPPAMQEKPSIAVLPFENMSADPEQEYFADGIAEEIITALSRFRWFFVIARNSTFTYKGRNVDVRQIGRELGVRYVLEGSVRKGDNRLRITTQLVESATGNHLWAEKYEGALEDVFDLQDRITEGVAGAIEPTLRQAEIERAKRKRLDNLDAYDLYLQALPHAWAWAPVEVAKAIELLDKALRIDPDYVAAHGLAAFCNSIFPTLSPNDDRRLKSVQHARAVLGPNTDDSLALALAAFALAFFERDYDVALDAAQRALSFTPNSPIVLTFSAIANAYAGHFQTAIEQALFALRLSPFDPTRFAAEMAAGYGYFFSGRFHEAAEAALRCLHLNPQFLPAYPLVVASRVRDGRAQDARLAAKRLLRFKPDFRVGEYVQVGRFKPELNEIYAAALREAGLPE